MYGLALIAILAVMGGAIAYIGDKLGTKVGKKKLTMFGLRPKHTSIIVTIVTGILIAASTLGVLTLTSMDVRTALFGMEALKAELTHLSQEVSRKNTELELSRSVLQAQTVEYTALNAKVKETADRLTATSAELSQVVAERDRTVAALSAIQHEYDQASGQLDLAQQEIAGLQATRDELDQKEASLTEARSSLQSDVDRLNELTANLKKGIAVVREGVVIFRAGEVLSTSVVRGGQSREETEKALEQIFYNTNRSIIERLGIQNNLDVLWIATDEFNQATNIITGTSESVIIRITAAGNTIYGEPTIGRLDLFPNRLIYRSATVVYAETVEADTISQETEGALLLFLQKVNAEAIKQGVLPDPIQGTVGSVGGAQLFETINRIKRYTGKVEIAAVTTEDIHTVGPLKITIRVRPVP